MKELYIDVGISVTSVGVLEDGELAELYIDDAHHTSIAGNVYKGRVENLVPGLNAAFVNIGMKKNAFLQMEGSRSIEDLWKGKELLVQVIREESGDKGPRVTSSLSIPGRNCVLLINDPTINISSKIRNSEKRQELQAMGQELLSCGYGVIFRTEAYETPREEIYEEYMDIKEKWIYAEKTAEFLKAPCLIFDAKDISSMVFREYLRKDIDRVYTNSKKLCERLDSLCRAKGLKTKVELAEEPRIYASLDSQIRKAADKRLQLPSGGFVIADRTEALVVFDVNTGNYSGNASKEETILKTNLEACRAIAKAIRINNYSGIILVDLIDMEFQESRNTVVEEMARVMEGDSARHKVYGLTSLGLLEISRERKGKCLRDIIYTQSSSEKLSLSSLLKALEDECVKRKLYYHENCISIRIESSIFKEATIRYPDYFTRLEDKLGVDVRAIPDNPLEGFQIVK